MAESNRLRFVSFVTGSFHACCLMVVLIWWGYDSPVAAQGFSELNTLVGFSLFLSLWAVSWFCAHRWLKTEWLSDDPGGAPALFHGLRWGGLNGTLFWFAILAIATIINIRHINITPTGFVQGLFGVPLFLIITGYLAFLVGVVISIPFLAVDFILVEFTLEVGQDSE